MRIKSAVLLVLLFEVRNVFTLCVSSRCYKRNNELVTTAVNSSPQFTIHGAGAEPTETINFPTDTAVSVPCVCSGDRAQGPFNLRTKNTNKTLDVDVHGRRILLHEESVKVTRGLEICTENYCTRRIHGFVLSRTVRSYISGKVWGRNN